ncbi:helix-turn-helix domain-containing protein [Phenylobacterium conjunctum]|jgi:DNA-binding transcriptional ArsR family regulator|uniref:Winged helix-turn-helix domain-containing protein n=1 Tax=Phenylobacterium conjunctum TaxID=1298959 RepID=A0ABW3T3L8_9CAUL
MFQPTQMAISADRRRMALRVAGYYFLQTATLVTRAIDEDLLTALVFLGVSRANVRPLKEDPAQDAAFAGAGDVPPDEMRRPVSVYAVAKDLRLPYETVRRHVVKLREAGMVEAGPGGVWVPNRVHLSPGLLSGMAENWEVARRFLRDAITIGAIPGKAPAPAGPDVSRRTVRLSIDYFLDSLTEMAGIVGLDALSLLVGMAVARGNMQHFAQDRETAETYAGIDAIPPDAVRRPVSVYAVSKGLGLPYETTRRYARRLTKEGWLERKADGGLILPAEVIGRPELLQAALQFAGATYAYLLRLAEIGLPPADEGVVPRRP